jgi:hypothetical protein
LRYRAGGLLAENINQLPDTVEQEKLNTAGKEWNSKYRDMLGIITETQVKKTIEKAVSNGLAV